MKIGIKVAPDNGIEVLENSQAKYCEVWFRLDWKEKYTELFLYMRKKNIQFGLHFWGMVWNKYFPNLVYYPEGIADETENMIQETIDIASKNCAYYVTYHPESLRLLELNLDTKTVFLSEKTGVEEEKGFSSLLIRSKRLKEYADKKSVALFIETTTLYMPKDFKEENKIIGRLNPIHSLGILNNRMVELGENGLLICFDIGHTICQYPDLPREDIYQKLLSDAKKLAPYTKLIHINTVIEPFNGADSHNGILEDDFRDNVLPNREQLKEIIEIFQKFDVLLIPEPQKRKMIENYKELLRLFG